jgi:hypothetical protein
MVIFDPIVYPMDTAWLTSRTAADYYRHSRPEYFRALEREDLVEPPDDSRDGGSEQEVPRPRSDRLSTETLGCRALLVG